MKRQNKTFNSEILYMILNYTCMTVFALLCVYPFIYVLALSLNNGIDAQRGGIYLFPRVFTLDNYKQVFVNNDITRAYGITIYRVVAGIISTIACNATFAFALSKKDLIGKKLWNWMIIIPMFFSAGIIPNYIILKMLHLTNNLLTFIVPYMYTPFYIIIFRTFFRELPPSLEESAKLDGAGEFMIFLRVIFPLSAPVIAAITLFTGVFHWNDWFTATAYIHDRKLWTLPTLLLNIMQSSDMSKFINVMFMRRTKVAITPESLKMAMLIITTLPILLIYPFLQKYFVKGIMVGSLKG